MSTNINKKWAELSAEVTKRGGDGEDFVAATKELYSLYSEDMYLWLARLYCPTVGGFYYSNSARDNDWFQPDIESTLQAVNILKHEKIIDSLADLPEKMQEQMKRFLLDRFDEEDGYFYHPHWGKNIIDSRRGRDLMWARSLCRQLDVKLPAPTADERLKAMVEGKGEDAVKELPDYLKSEEAFLKYLKSYDWEKSAYASGNNLVAQANQVVAAGLAPVAIDFLNSIQNKETGFWGSEEGYFAINGYLKITSFYVEAKAQINHAYNAAMSTMDLLTSKNDCLTATFQYNTWFALGNLQHLFRTIGGKENDELAETIAKGLISRAPEAIRATAKKALDFRKTDGSFSYCKKESSYVSQAAHVAVKGTNEGDVNATILLSSETIDKIFRALELSDFVVPLFGKDHRDRFFAEISKHKCKFCK